MRYGSPDFGRFEGSLVGVGLFMGRIATLRRPASFRSVHHVPRCETSPPLCLSQCQKFIPSPPGEDARKFDPPTNKQAPGTARFVRSLDKRFGIGSDTRAMASGRAGSLESL